MGEPPTSIERSAFVDEVVESATVLASLDDAAAAEAWASGAVAEWLRIGGVGLADSLAARSRLAEALVRWIETGSEPTLDRDGGPDFPEWSTDLGTAAPVGGLRLHDPDRDGEVVLIVEFRSDSGARHDLSVTLRGGRLVDLAVGPAGLTSAVRDAPDARFVAEPVDPRSALGDVRSGLELAEAADLGDRARLDLALLCRRLDLDPAEMRHLFATPDRSAVELTRDPDDDRYAAGLVMSALGPIVTDGDGPPAVASAITGFAERGAAADPDVLAVLSVAGRSVDDLARDPSGTLIRAVGAYLAPVDLSAHPHDEQEVIAELEPADWVGVILGVMRQTDDAPLTGDAAVAFINRCPEIATSIPARDAAVVAWAFDRVFYAWECTRVLGEDGLLTDAGRWLLPRAVAEVWDGSGDS